MPEPLRKPSSIDVGGSADTNAFLAEQYRNHADRVFRRCLTMGCGDEAWAEDVTHDVFIKLVTKAPSLDNSESLIGWLLTVASRMCIDRLRRERGVWHRVRDALAATAAPEVDVLQTPLGEDGLAAELDRSLATLPPRERAVLLMKYVDGQRQTVIAATLGCSEGQVSKLLARGIARLRKLGWEEEHV
jgi:RNA polymerase sigma factor (sigma-70 family)